MENKENIHEKHRERLRNLYKNFGIDSFSDHEVLEMLLYFSIPRKDTNETAHKLINKFGSLSAVLEANAHDLLSVSGIGAKSAEHISYTGAVIRAYENDKAKQYAILEASSELSDPKTIKNILTGLFSGIKNEAFYLIFLNTRKKIIGKEKLTEGTIDTAEVYSRNVITAALRANAHSVIMAHNHLSGNPYPSNSDLSTTRVVQNALRTINVQLIDHYIIGGKEVSGIIEMGLL